MRLINRKKLLTLMTVQELTVRELARAAGYKNGAHGQIQRLTSGRTDRLGAEKAVAVAERLGVDVGVLFVPVEASVTEPAGAVA